MAIVTDIIDRDGLDGAGQLLRLRAYLNDTDVASYEYPDSFLIPLLVLNPREIVWRGLLNIPELTEQDILDGKEELIPWSYDSINPVGYINILRSLTGYTDETIEGYTDYKFLKLLEVMPLRRIIQAIKALDAADDTYPSDENHPVRVLRDLTGDIDKTNPENKDSELMSRLLSYDMNPYMLVLSIIDMSIAASSTDIAKSGTGGFAAIDGISFSSDKLDGKSETTQTYRDIVESKSSLSVYDRSDQFYFFYEDGIDKPSERNGDWYAV